MFRCSGLGSDAWIFVATAGSVTINDMAYCQQAVSDLDPPIADFAERHGPLPGGIRIKVTIQTAAAGRRLTCHGPGNAWETANSCWLPAESARA